MTIPSDYPSTPLVRRHGPAGYSDYASYRPWLRDEFAFRCVFCLRREVWSRVVGEFAIDHFEPIANRPDRATDYENLLYVCGPCNIRKGSQFVADPLASLIAATVEVRTDGTIDVRTRQARRIVRILQLDSPEMTAFRAMWIDVIQLAAAHDPGLYHQLLAFPDDLPDLSSLKPPGGNIRPEGIEQCYLPRRDRGELSATY
jgi:HNH endonuclease